MSIADINRAGFSERTVGSRYARQQGFDHFLEERAALNWLQQDRPPINDLLDLGVGAGRTVEPLRAITKRYVGVDFSPAMVELCRQRYPIEQFLAADARDLYMLQAESFDLVFFSYNGIDYVDHSGRLKILSEVRRVLRSNGYFIFSSHNRAAKPESLWRDRLVWFLVHLPLIAWHWRRHLWFRRLETRKSEYEIRNDPGDGWRLLTYYIDSERQSEQLNRFGFHGIEIFDRMGHHLNSGAKNSQSAWLCYLCRSS
jgi:SAM-dependent methyltransferase